MIPFVELEQKRIVEVAPTVAEPIVMPQNEVFEGEINAKSTENEGIINGSGQEVFDSEIKSWLLTLTWDEWSIVIYGMGLLVALIVLIRRLWEIVLLSRQQQNDANKDWIEISGSFTAASFLGFIFLNSKALTEEETQQVLLHERTHAQLFHSADVLFVELCKVILWFNPIVYLCKKSLVEIHEYEVDEHLATQLDAKTYAHLILKLAIHSSHSLIHPFGKHPVTNRIHFLFQKPTTAMKKLLYAFVLPLILAGVLAFAPRKEVIVYKESVAKMSVAKVETAKDVPVKVYPLRVHNKHVWWYFKQQKMEALNYFSESNLTLNDLCMLESGGVYYLVNPNSLNIKDIAEVNRLTAKRWKVEIAIIEHSLDAEGKLAKISLAIKNLKTNQLSAPEIIDMAEARELGKQGAYLYLEMRNPYWKPQITLEYGDKSLTVSKCSKMGKEHQMSAGLKLSKDQIEYAVYPDKANLPTFQKVSAYFKKEGFNLMISNEKYDTNQQLSSFDLAVTNDKNEIVNRRIVLNNLRYYVHLVTRPESRNRYDEPLIIRANKFSRKIQIETTTERSEYFKKKGLLKPFIPEKAEVKPPKTVQNEAITEENSEEFSKVVKDMYSKDIFFKRVQIKAKIDGVKDVLIFARSGEGVTATGLAVAAGKFPVYYLDGVKVEEEIVKSLRPSHIKKVDILEPAYNRYSAFVKEHKLDVKNEKFVWMVRRAFDFKKLPSPNLSYSTR
ncbi:M56 family metallopeptidase [Runella aurantiaca]|nr:M56 family metallopeptidase [Runella aurantiaca]